MLGEVIANYEVLSKLGEGGMGAVYLAKHRLIGRRAAIKVLLPELSANEEMVNRFFNEARSTAAIKHVGLIDVFDYGIHNGAAYIVMEFLEGESLAAFLKREPHPAFDFVAAIGRQVASAVGAAHAQGIVHRDLKPDNVFLIHDDEVAFGVRAKVLDFGIAKLTGPENAASLKTRTGSLMGTPAYMSPEQCRGAGAVDARSDIYAVGCILYEMVAGRIPFISQGLGEMISMHMFDEPPALRTLNPETPDWLEAAIQRAMVKKVEGRFQTMDELATSLGGRAARATTVPAGTSPSAPQTHTTLSRAVSEIATRPPRTASKGGRTAIFALALIVVVGGGLGIFFATRVPSQAEVLPASVAAPTPPVIPAPVAPAPVTSSPVSAAVVESAPVSAPAPLPLTITLKVDSKPAGATVYAVADGAKLGRTPLSLERPRGTGMLALVVKLDGRKDATVELSLEHDDKASVELERRRSGSSSSATPISAPASKPTSAVRPHTDTTIDPFSVKP
jgi:eukaryotic-like serine/threonine-protein kinase